jgi:acetoin utilization deacetylase AcuC-like enzyme
MKIISSPAQSGHDPKAMLVRGQWTKPVERAERLEALVEALQRDGHEAEPPLDHSLDALLRVHALDYIHFLRIAYSEWSKQTSAGPEVLPNTHPHPDFRLDVRSRGRPPPGSISGRAGWFIKDLNCAIGEGTWSAGAASAQSAIHGAQLVIEGAGCAFAACRPPGHHAYRDQASGFCFVNNAAVAADMLAQAFGRVALVDIDTHHGDGSQSIFYDRSDVFFGSTHTDPSQYYPFYTGYSDECGVGNGAGFNLNLPLPPGAGDSEFVGTCNALAEASKAHECSALVISAGWDAHEEDPLSLLKVTDDGYESVGRILGRLRLPTLIVQEGGYSIEVISRAPRRFLNGFLDTH